MSTNGVSATKPISEFTFSDFKSEELEKFIPLVERFAKGELDKKGLFVALKGNKDDCFKVMRLGQLVKSCARGQDAVAELSVMEQKIVSLQHSIQGHRDAVSQSASASQPEIVSTMSGIRLK